MSIAMKRVWTKRLIAADVFAAFQTVLWASLFRMMATHYAALPSFGYSGTWDFWVYFPLVMTLSLLLAAVVFNFVVRRADALTLVTGAALLVLLPYGMMIGGGV